MISRPPNAFYTRHFLLILSLGRRHMFLRDFFIDGARNKLPSASFKVKMGGRLMTAARQNAMLVVGRIAMAISHAIFIFARRQGVAGADVFAMLPVNAA